MRFAPPETRLQLRGTVARPDRRGLLRERIEVLAADAVAPPAAAGAGADVLPLDEKILAETRGRLAAAKGHALELALTDRGLVESLGGKPARAVEEARRALGEALDAVAVPLPEEPVGEGAHWEVTGATDLAGVAIDRRATFELQHFDGTTATVRFQVEATQHARQETRITVEGTRAFRLDELLPRTARAHLTRRGAPMTIDTDVTFEPPAP
jgi:hypothetical protein